MKHYFLPFEPSAKVNYITLFTLLENAEYNTETKAYDTIRYASIPKLAEQLNLSKSTLSRMISNDDKNDYKLFLSADTKEKVITLNTSFSNSKNTEKKPFIVLTSAEVQLLKEKSDNLLCKYLMYVKYYCGYSKTKETNFTANQFLNAIGYETSSNSTKNSISSYNALLKEKKLIQIETYFDEMGHRRNRYTYNF